MELLVNIVTRAGVLSAIGTKGLGGSVATDEYASLKLRDLGQAMCTTGYKATWCEPSRGLRDDDMMKAEHDVSGVLIKVQLTLSNKMA